MFQERRTLWDFTSIRRCYRVPNGAYLETISLGHTVYFCHATPGFNQVETRS